MNILSLFLTKKEKAKVVRTNAVKYNYACEDANLEWNIRAYLNNLISVKECFQSFIEYMAYIDYLHVPENEAIFPLLEDFLEDATWKNKWTADCGDYRPDQPKRWLDCIYSVYDYMLLDITCAENFLKEWNKDITTEAVMKVIQNRSVTPEIYENKDLLTFKKDELKTIINEGKLTPKEALLLIKDNWSVLYPYQSSYEAIEYCVAASEKHTDCKYFQSAFRNYGYKMGSIYRKAKEKYVY